MNTKRYGQCTALCRTGYRNNYIVIISVLLLRRHMCINIYMTYVVDIHVYKIIHYSYIFLCRLIEMHDQLTIKVICCFKYKCILSFSHALNQSVLVSNGCMSLSIHPHDYK